MDCMSFVSISLILIGIKSTASADSIRNHNIARIPGYEIVSSVVSSFVYYHNVTV